MTLASDCQEYFEMGFIDSVTAITSSTVITTASFTIATITFMVAVAVIVVGSSSNFEYCFVVSISCLQNLIYSYCYPNLPVRFTQC